MSEVRFEANIYASASAQNQSTCVRMSSNKRTACKTGCPLQINRFSHEYTPCNNQQSTHGYTPPACV
jgi:hypothetical protein